MGSEGFFMSSNVARRSEVPYAQIANCVLNDSKLSLKAKGLYSYMFSKPLIWDFSFLRIAKDHSDGKEAVRTGLVELEKAGYLKREKRVDGRTIYILTHEPSSDYQTEVIKEPSSDFPNLVKSQVPIIGTSCKTDSSQSNTDSESNTDVKDLKPEASDVQGINTILGAFKKKINPVINFGNKTQRKAAQELIDEFGLEQVLFYIDYLVTVSGNRYAPTITNPLQLKEKYAALIIFAQREENNTKKTTLTVI